MKIEQKTKQLLKKEVEEAKTLEELSKVAKNFNTLTTLTDNERAEQEKQKMEQEQKNLEQKFNLETKKLDLENEKLDLENEKLELEKEKIEKENKIKKITAISGIVVAGIGVVGNIIIKLMSIKHSNNLYNCELQMTYKDHLIPTQTMKELSRNALNNSIK